jgi:hypothetical protein
MNFGIARLVDFMSFVDMTETICGHMLYIGEHEMVVPVLIISLLIWLVVVPMILDFVIIVTRK